MPNWPRETPRENISYPVYYIALTVEGGWAVILLMVFPITAAIGKATQIEFHWAQMVSPNHVLALGSRERQWNP